MAYRYRAVTIAGKTRLKHRHLAEMHLGRRLRSDEDVHHRNENRLDNADANLAVMPTAEHRALHADQRLKHPREKACTVCSATFTPHPTKRKRQITCSAPCANVQRVRTEKSTKARPPMAAALVAANFTADEIAPGRPVAPAPLLEAAE